MAIEIDVPETPITLTNVPDGAAKQVLGRLRVDTAQLGSSSSAQTVPRGYTARRTSDQSNGGGIEVVEFDAGSPDLPPWLAHNLLTGELTVQADGYYELSYSVGADNGSAVATHVITTWLRVGVSNVDGTKGRQGISPQSQGRCSLDGMVLALQAGDVITVTYQADSVVDAQADECTCTIRQCM